MSNDTPLSENTPPTTGAALLERIGWPVYAEGEKGMYTLTSGDGSLRSGLIVDPKGISAYVETLHEGKPCRTLEASWDHGGAPVSLRLYGDEADAGNGLQAFLDQTAVLREVPGGRGSYVCMGRLRPAAEAVRPRSGMR